ncbi:phosphatidylserine decarboxylase-domain-containing protein [Trametes polyzona]|nr:phosphatidylserine decarboxylase-domain-containing protein [Trametes polyzona]
MATSDIVQQLRDYLKENPDFKAEFECSFEKAKGYGLPEFEEWGINTLDDYLNYYESFLHWVPTENSDGTSVVYHICMFYFVIGLFPVCARQSPILPSTHSPYTWLSEWIIRYAKEMGKWMDSPDSISEAAIDTFYKADSYHMWDYERVDWKTFNEFFARHIKKSARPVDAQLDSAVIVHPADAVFDGWWQVDEDANCQFTAKGVPWNIRELLNDAGAGTNYGHHFAGGKFCHSFLGPQDYHRQHAPVSGRVVEARVIEGLCYLEVDVVYEPKDNGRPHLAMRRHLQAGGDSDTGLNFDAPDNAGYQFIQARALILIDNPDLGLVAVLPIGMAQVSSVVLSVKAGDDVRKGQEISYFQLGGSDVVMVFQAKANVNFTAEEKTHYNFGRQVATAAPSSN